LIIDTHRRHRKSALQHSSLAVHLRRVLQLHHQFVVFFFGVQVKTVVITTRKEADFAKIFTDFGGDYYTPFIIDATFCFTNYIQKDFLPPGPTGSHNSPFATT